jgi:hypothetical protein
VTKPVRPNEFAQHEIAHELRWYERESTGLGDRLWSDIEIATQLISHYPQIGEVIRVRRGSEQFAAFRCVTFRSL